MVKAILSSQKTTDVLPLSGGTMTGPITLNGAPTEDLHASTKRYVDDAKATAASDAQSKATKALNDAKSYTDEKTAGLTGAMHFRGTVTSIPPSGSYASGDVVLNGNKEYVYDGKDWKELGDEGSYVLKTQKVNNHALSGDISLTAADVGARPNTWMPTAAEVGADPAGTASAVQTALQQEIDSKASTQALNDGLTKKQDKITASGILKGNGSNVAQAVAGTDYVPPSRKINGKALSTDITLSASDVSALPTTGGTMSGAIAMGGNKITGLAYDSADDSAARQADILSATRVTSYYGRGTDFYNKFSGNLGWVEIMLNTSSISYPVTGIVARRPSNGYYYGYALYTISSGNPTRFVYASIECRKDRIFIDCFSSRVGDLKAIKSISISYEKIL